MRHRTTRKFWAEYALLPADIQRKADRAYNLLKTDPSHPSLHFKKVGKVWSARVDDSYRAVAIRREDGFVWLWIGSHDEYERLIRTN
jgi:hypothetical protein